MKNLIIKNDLAINRSDHLSIAQRMSATRSAPKSHRLEFSRNFLQFPRALFMLWKRSRLKIRGSDFQSLTHLTFDLISDLSQKKLSQSRYAIVNTARLFAKRLTLISLFFFYNLLLLLLNVLLNQLQAKHNRSKFKLDSTMETEIQVSIVSTCYCLP